MIAAGFVVMVFVPVDGFVESASAVGWVLAVVGIVLMPFMLLSVVGIQAVNPMSDATWARPTHRSNPFRLGNPLLFFHFAAYVIAAGGAGMMASSLWRGCGAFVDGAIGVIGAVMVLVSVRLCMLVFKGKMAVEPPGQRLEETGEVRDG